jgi:hypothetical protein
MTCHEPSQPVHTFTLHIGAVTTELAEQRPSTRWSRRQTLAAVAVAAVVGGLGGAAIYGATAQTHSFGGPHGMSGPQHGGPPPPGFPPPAGGAPPPPAQATDAAVLHSESVVSDGNGGFVTKIAQTGTVDEVTLQSVVVRSDDGYTQIYTFPSNATNSVQPNDAVTVEATRTGATVTLDRIGEAPAQ